MRQPSLEKLLVAVDDSKDKIPQLINRHKIKTVECSALNGTYTSYLLQRVRDHLGKRDEKIVIPRGSGSMLYLNITDSLIYFFIIFINIFILI